MKSMSMVSYGISSLYCAGDVVLGRGEGVRPGDDAGALGIHVGLVEGGLDHVGGQQVGLEDNLEGDLVGGVERRDDLGGVLGDVLEHLVTVEVLGAGAEIELVLLDLEHISSLLTLWLFSESGGAPLATRPLLRVPTGAGAETGPRNGDYLMTWFAARSEKTATMMTNTTPRMSCWISVVKPSMTRPR